MGPTSALSTDADGAMQLNVIVAIIAVLLCCLLCACYVSLRFAAAGMLGPKAQLSATHSNMNSMRPSWMYLPSEQREAIRHQRYAGSGSKHPHGGRNIKWCYCAETSQTAPSESRRQIFVDDEPEEDDAVRPNGNLPVAETPRFIVAGGPGRGKMIELRHGRVAKGQTGPRSASQDALDIAEDESTE